MNEELQVRGCQNITFIYSHQETVSVFEKTQFKQNIQDMKARVKKKQKQLTDKYKNNSRLHDSNKMINNEAHKMCA